MKLDNAQVERSVKLKSINQFITCYICKGYLIEATTITECLHTFCKSCIVQYLEENNTCPKCNNLIHQSHPLLYISHDRSMQDIVYKVVPNLQNKELKLQFDFYTRRGLPVPKQLTENGVHDEVYYHNNYSNCDYHRRDEQVNLTIESGHENLKPIERQFIRCSVQATITHIKKFVALKIFQDVNRFKDIELLCNEEILGKDHTLKFVSVTRWKYKDVPLALQYRPKFEL